MAWKKKFPNRYSHNINLNCFILASSMYNNLYNYKQGAKIRKLKEAKVEKSELQPEIDLLLQLKSKLSIAKGLPADDGQKKKQK